MPAANGQSAEWLGRALQIALWVGCCEALRDPAEGRTDSRRPAGESVMQPSGPLLCGESSRAGLEQHVGEVRQSPQGEDGREPPLLPSSPGPHLPPGRT
jgi:hypothetical protein